MTNTQTPTPRPISLALKRALGGHCPKCGEGKLYKAYLKAVDECAVCHEPLGRIRADDGPAWLGILIVGHIVVSLVVLVKKNTEWPDALVIPMFGFLTLALVLGVLPFCKAVFIAAIWNNKSPGSGK